MVVENVFGFFLTMDDFGLLSLQCPPKCDFSWLMLHDFGLFWLRWPQRFYSFFACAEQILVFFGYGWVFSPYGRVFFPYSVPFLPYSSVSLGSVCPKPWFSPSSLPLSLCDAIVFIASVKFLQWIFRWCLSVLPFKGRRAPREPQRKFTH